MKRSRLLVLLIIIVIPSAAISQVLDNGQETEEEKPPGARDFDFWSYALNMLVALLIVIGLIVLVVWLLRSATGRRMSFGGKLLQLVTSVPLGDRRFISVLRVGERYYLVGISPSEINLLSELDPEDVKRHQEAGGEPEATGFGKLLKRFLGGSQEGGG